MRQIKRRTFYLASDGMLFVVCNKRSCMRNICSEIRYTLGSMRAVINLTNLVDLQIGKRGEGDRIWLEASTILSSNYSACREHELSVPL
jgi:hypothetical protein